MRNKSLITGALVLSHAVLSFTGFFLAGGFAKNPGTLPVTTPIKESLMGYSHGALSPISFFYKVIDGNADLKWNFASEVYHLGVHSGILASFFIAGLFILKKIR
mgnify:CR=1 FL=1